MSYQKSSPILGNPHSQEKFPYNVNDHALFTNRAGATGKVGSVSTGPLLGQQKRLSVTVWPWSPYLPREVGSLAPEASGLPRRCVDFGLWPWPRPG